MSETRRRTLLRTRKMPVTPLYGWECPRCGRCFSPSVKICLFCPARVVARDPEPDLLPPDQFDCYYTQDVNGKWNRHPPKPPSKGKDAS